ncbi:synbindin [Capsaspora owczarzaki ATCC 30864]|uniref:Trafficking protein particle complex subunit n=1 Tax=Capsaspora owczarzaki (strain ATCC 30864) TaxID=595528 RepID=A0A0D2U421_CAPO3|nr:synbindin [Capsaspora owczarzaki ATCC 30864]KJE89931.1 synbindin [Capsaspora owczarzaki ATCC 30864]|eukprot:XP_004349851.1 synbindin [Capsaspora owczarzaki ATCC 30864]
MVVFGVYVINKAGGLIYGQELGATPKLRANDRLTLASMFHSLYAITSNLSPQVQSSGIEVIETDTFKIQCKQTLTGTKFFVMSDPAHTGLDALLRRLYELYSDYVLKNPFYTPEMPIRCELFDINLARLMEQYESGRALTATF